MPMKNSDRTKMKARISQIATLLCVSIFLPACSSSTGQDDSEQTLYKRIIQIPIKESNSSFEVAWIDAQSYLVVDPINLRFYKVTGNEIDTLPRPAIEFNKKDFHNGIIQTGYGLSVLPYIYGGIYVVSDTITAYTLPLGSIGLQEATITKDGKIYVWGSHGLWVSKIGSGKLDANSDLFRYNTHSLYADDTIGILSQINTISLFRDDKVYKVINFSDIGIEPSAVSGYWSDWIGKMNGNYYILQGMSAIKLSPSGEVLATLPSPGNQIVSFTDGDCFFSKRADLIVWCNDGQKVATFTSQNSDVDMEMIYSGKNPEGHWISNGKQLMLLDTEKAKSIARK